MLVSLFLKKSSLTLFSNFHRYQLIFNYFEFLEAEMAKNRIEELKFQEFQRRREEMIFNQTREKEEVEQAHIMEY